MTTLSQTTLCAIAQSDGAETLGVVTADGVIDVRAVAAAAKIDAPLTLDDLLQRGGASELAAVIAAAPASAVSLRDAGSLVYGRLFQRPGKIVCIGLNYRQHAREIGMAEPDRPPVFAKFSNSLLAHRGQITLPPAEVASHFDYETELLVVIGKTARNVSEEAALDYVAGYCTANDFSARDLQIGAAGGQWLLSKTLDGFAPIGPHFVSADQVPDPNTLSISTWVNGELRQSSSTADFIFNVQKIIAYLSRYWPLSPGDIIFTGTPQGVVLGQPPEARVWLKSGDRVESEVGGLGKLGFSLR
jgi:2-keto-4-pentenoate hydratase/2-oxohepta-3-ene-1,7-dioic acid hydratase in catechol pathway